jgi:IS30 family transposase
MQGRPFSFLERQKLELFLLGNLSLRTIGTYLRRNHGNLSNERKGGIDRTTGRYSAVLAQERADRRKERGRRRGRGRKIDDHPLLKAYIIRSLKKGHMPHVIAGCLKRSPPLELRGISVSAETIFLWIYEGTGRYEGLFQYLRFGRRKRKKQRMRTKQRDKTRIPNRVSIHERPLRINERTEYGHWESDSMLFMRGQKARLSVQYERKAKYVVIHRLSNGSAEATDSALEQAVHSLPRYLWRSITFDNGKEGMNHGNLKKKYRMETYFCDPYASYQKGGVEHVNGMIRTFLPRRTDMSHITHEDIYAIQERINNTPRKSLGYKTPKEVIEENCGKGVVL